VLNCLIFNDYDSLRDVREKKNKKNDRIVNIDKEKSEANHQSLFYILLCAW
jgi:hypothetical protein